MYNKINKLIDNIQVNVNYIDLLNSHLVNKINFVDLKRYNRIIREQSLRKIELSKILIDNKSKFDIKEFLENITLKNKGILFELIKKGDIYLSEKEKSSLFIIEEPLINHGFHVTPELKDISNNLKFYDQESYEKILNIITPHIKLEGDNYITKKEKSKKILKLIQSSYSEQQKLFNLFFIKFKDRAVELKEEFIYKLRNSDLDIKNNIVTFKSKVLNNQTISLVIDGEFKIIEKNEQNIAISLDNIKTIRKENSKIKAKLKNI